MKRILTLIAGVVCFALYSNADNNRIITFEELPSPAKTFITANFANLEIFYVKEEKDIFDLSYEVVFSQGTKIEFDENGEWWEIDCKYDTLDGKFVPDEIEAYVKNKWPNAQFRQIEKGRYGYDVSLTNNLDLTFDKKFNLIEIDD